MSNLHVSPDNLVRAIATVVLLAFLMLASAKILWCNRLLLRGIAGRLFDQLSLARWQMQPDSIEQSVAQKCSERRVARARAAAAGSVFVGIVVEAFVLERLVWKRGLLSNDESPIELIQWVSLQALVFTPAFLSLFPATITARTVDALYIWELVLLVVMIVGDEKAGQESTSTSDFLFRLGAFYICLFDLKLWVNAIGLLLVVIASTFMGVRPAPAVFCIILFFMLAWIDHTLTAGVRHEIHAQKSRGELAAVKTLLGAICDAIVEVDSNLCLTQHSRELSNILLHGSGRSLQGLTMQEFMPDEGDRRTFEERVSGAGRDSSAHTEVFPATICDSNAVRINMEFFSVSFVGPDSRRHHLLGMREFTDIAPLTPSPRLERRAQPQAARPPRPGARGSSSWGARGRGPSTAPAIVGRRGGADRTPTPDRSSEASGSSSGTTAAARAGPSERKKETGHTAMMFTLTEALMRWQVTAPEGSCCTFHAVVAITSGLLGTMASSPCRRAFGPMEDEWQCRTCGVVGDDYRERKRGRRSECLVCRGTGPDLGHVGGSRSGASSSGASTSL